MIADTVSEAMDQVVVFSSSAAGLTFIEQLQISATKPCTRPNTKYLIGVDQNEHKALLTKAACKCWDCETCAARNARVWIACMVNGARELATPMSLLTLTAHRYHRKEKAYQTYDKAGRNFIIVFSPTLRFMMRIFITFEYGNNTATDHSIITSLSIEIWGRLGQKRTLLNAEWDIWQIGVDLITWELRRATWRNTR